MANRRSLLRKQLTEAWKRTIENSYADGLINSERELQVHFCIELYREFGFTWEQRRLFVEPTLRFTDDALRTPDVLICNTRQIIGVVELKYTPRARPPIQKDFNTLACFRVPNAEIVVENQRFRGDGDRKPYTLASDVVLCWAAVHSSSSRQFPEPEVNAMGEQLLTLEAVTSRDADAEIWVNGKPEA